MVYCPKCGKSYKNQKRLEIHGKKCFAAELAQAEAYKQRQLAGNNTNVSDNNNIELSPDTLTESNDQITPYETMEQYNDDSEYSDSGSYMSSVSSNNRKSVYSQTQQRRVPAFNKSLEHLNSSTISRSSTPAIGSPASIVYNNNRKNSYLNQISKLTKEKDELEVELETEREQSTRRAMADNRRITSLSQQIKVYEEKIAEIEEEKYGLENKLISTEQLLHSESEDKLRSNTQLTGEIEKMLRLHKDELDGIKSELNTEQQINANKITELTKQLTKIQNESKLTLDDTRMAYELREARLQKELDELHTQIENEMLATKSYNDSKLEQLKKSHELELERVKTTHSQFIQNLEHSYSITISGLKEKNQTDLTQFETEITQLRKKLSDMETRYQQEISNVKESQMSDFSQQFRNRETSHQTMIGNLKKTHKEELNNMQHRTDDLERINNSLTNQITSLKDIISELRQNTNEVKQQFLQALNDQRQKYETIISEKTEETKETQLRANTISQQLSEQQIYYQKLIDTMRQELKQKYEQEYETEYSEKIKKYHQSLDAEYEQKIKRIQSEMSVYQSKTDRYHHMEEELRSALRDKNNLNEINIKLTQELTNSKIALQKQTDIVDKLREEHRTDKKMLSDTYTRDSEYKATKIKELSQTLQTINDRAKRSEESYNVRIEELNRLIVELRISNIELKSRAEASETVGTMHRGVSENQLLYYEKELQVLKDKMDKHYNEKTQLTDKYQTIDAEYQKLIDSNNLLSQQYEQLRVEYDALSEKYRNLTDANNSLKDQCNKHISALSIIQHDINEKSIQLSNKEVKHQELLTEFRLLTEKYDLAVADANNADAQLSNTMNMYSDLEKLNKTLQTQYSQLQHKHNILKTDFSDARQEYNSQLTLLKEENGKYKGELTGLYDKIRLFERDDYDFCSITDKLQIEIQEKTQIQLELTNLTDKYNKLSDVEKQLRIELSNSQLTMTQEINSLKTDLQCTTEELKTAKQKYETITENIKNISPESMMNMQKQYSDRLTSITADYTRTTQILQEKISRQNEELELLRKLSDNSYSENDIVAIKLEFEEIVTNKDVELKELRDELAALKNRPFISENEVNKKIRQIRDTALENARSTNAKLDSVLTEKIKAENTIKELSSVLNEKTKENTVLTQHQSEIKEQYLMNLNEQKISYEREICLKNDQIKKLEIRVTQLEQMLMDAVNSTLKDSEPKLVKIGQ